MLHRAGNLTIAELHQFGHDQLADEIGAWLAETLPELPQQSDHPVKRAHLATLPLKCPFCGGVLRPDQIEWFDDVTGECPYCGSAVREER
jgi:hypothetical protein